MASPLLITVAVITYNRAAILEECLQSLKNQTIKSEFFELIVIDNNSTDHTQEVAKQFASFFSHFRIVKEMNQGVSNARNRGYAEARTEWILYLDDDVKALENVIEQALDTINNFPYKIFSGIYLPWYKYGKPYWYKDKYALFNNFKYDRVSAMRPNANEYLIGGIMVANKQILQEIGGFNTRLGMKGNKIAYNEEPDLQLRLLKKGIKTGHDPNLKVYHLVPTNKIEVEWFFKSAFAQGRDNVEMRNISSHPLNLILISTIAIGMILVHLIIYTPRLLRNDYYIQNWMIDVFKKVAKRIGTVYTASLKRADAKFKSNG